MSKDTGGPAFPQPNQMHQQNPNPEAGGGMTLRDYFAAKALQGICASGPAIEWSNPRLATEAYEIADAMLKAREAV